MNRFQVICCTLVCILVFSERGNLALAVDVFPVFTLDNTLSSTTIEANFVGSATSDNDTTFLSGTVNSTLTIDTSGGTPLITGLNFTGAHYTADKNPLELTLPDGLLGNTIDVKGDNIAGTLTTPTPPASITSGGGGDLSYTFSAASHNTSFNEGNLRFLLTGTATEVGSYNLADPGNAIGGPGPGSPLATLNLTQGATAQNLTQFTAQVTFPMGFSDTITAAAGPNVDVTTTGTIVASGSFFVDVGLTSTALLTPGDSIIAIDTDGGSLSAYPPGEEPTNVVNGAATEKYLNFAGANSGFIVTPGGSTTVRSMQFSSANDFVERDPDTWELYGTNDPISSLDNSLGTAENWTLIGSDAAAGATGLPAARLMAGTVVPVTNSTSYTHYKVLFPTTKNLGDPIQQLGEASFFESTDGTGTDLLSLGDAVLAIDADFLSESNHLPFESATEAIDGVTTTKYTNSGNRNSGFIVTPSVGSTVLDSFQITTADDNVFRDPKDWEIYGTNDAITSTDNSLGDDENWTLIDSGAVDLPVARLTAGPLVSVTTSTAYTSYRVIFTALRDPNLDPFMQVGDIQFFSAASTTPGDFDQDGDVDGKDFLEWQRGFGMTVGAEVSDGDANNDGKVDDTDLQLWQANYGSQSPLLAAAATVPEPGTLVLGLGFALATCFVPRRRPQLLPRQ